MATEPGMSLSFCLQMVIGAVDFYVANFATNGNCCFSTSGSSVWQSQSHPGRNSTSPQCSCKVDTSVLVAIAATFIGCKHPVACTKPPHTPRNRLYTCPCHTDRRRTHSAYSTSSWSVGVRSPFPVSGFPKTQLSLLCECQRTCIRHRQYDPTEFTPTQTSLHHHQVHCEQT
jgi:hypothetical protein